MKKYKCGLIVGKFSPLHKGHEYAINFAQDLCDILLVLTYSQPEFENYEVAKRERWLQQLFPKTKILAFNNERLKQLSGRELPDNNATDDIQREFVSWVCKEHFKMLPDAVFTSEPYGPGFATYLEKSFQMPVEHVFVDQNRKKFPISGTDLRENIHAQRHFLAPYIYSDFVKTICFLGAESTGKSTFAKILADKYETSFVPEYGRALWEEKKGVLDFDDMLTIATTHINHENEKRLKAYRYLFVDTSPLTTLFYSQNLFKNASPELEVLATRRYDHLFLCYPDFPLVQDGTRSDENFRQSQHEWYLEELKNRNLDFIPLQGSLEGKIAKVEDVLKAAKA